MKIHVEHESKEVWRQLLGKTIVGIDFPDELTMRYRSPESLGEEHTEYDENVVLTTKEGDKIAIASFDYDGYASGIYVDNLSEEL